MSTIYGLFDLDSNRGDPFGLRGGNDTPSLIAAIQQRRATHSPLAGPFQYLLARRDADITEALAPSGDTNKDIVMSWMRGRAATAPFDNALLDAETLAKEAVSHFATFDFSQEVADNALSWAKELLAALAEAAGVQSRMVITSTDYRVIEDDDLERKLDDTRSAIYTGDISGAAATRQADRELFLSMQRQMQSRRVALDDVFAPPPARVQRHPFDDSLPSVRATYMHNGKETEIDWSNMSLDEILSAINPVEFLGRLKNGFDNWLDDHWPQIKAGLIKAGEVSVAVATSTIVQQFVTTALGAFVGAAAPALVYGVMRGLTGMGTAAFFENFAAKKVAKLVGREVIPAISAATRPLGGLDSFGPDTVGDRTARRSKRAVPDDASMEEFWDYWYERLYDDYTAYVRKVQLPFFTEDPKGLARAIRSDQVYRYLVSVWEPRVTNSGPATQMTQTDFRILAQQVADDWAAEMGVELDAEAHSMAHRTAPGTAPGTSPEIERRAHEIVASWASAARTVKQDLTPDDVPAHILSASVAIRLTRQFDISDEQAQLVGKRAAQNLIAALSENPERAGFEAYGRGLVEGLTDGMKRTLTGVRVILTGQEAQAQAEAQHPQIVEWMVGDLTNNNAAYVSEKGTFKDAQAAYDAVNTLSLAQAALKQFGLYPQDNDYSAVTTTLGEIAMEAAEQWAATTAPKEKPLEPDEKPVEGEPAAAAPASDTPAPAQDTTQQAQGAPVQPAAGQ